MLLHKKMISSVLHVNKCTTFSCLKRHLTLLLPGFKPHMPICELSVPICCKQPSFLERRLMAHMADADMPESTEMTEQIWAAFQNMAPLIDKTLRLEPNKAAPKRQKKEGHSQSDAALALPPKINLALAMTQLAKLALQLDRDMQLMKKEDTFLFFFGNKGKDSCIHLLMQTTETWAQEHQQQQQAAQPAAMIPLRLKLMQVLFTTLLKKVDQLGAAPQGSELQLMAQQNLVLLPDMTCPYLEWDHQNKRLRASQKRPLTLKHVHQLCSDMLESLSDLHLVQKFHSLPSTNNHETTTWKLQLSLRHDQPWQQMQMLSHLSIWLLMGGTLKPHSLTQSPVAHQLQSTLGLTPQGKGRGKGKAKTKTKMAKRDDQ